LDPLPLGGTTLPTTLTYWRKLLVLQCQLRYAASSSECVNYSRPEPFFAPLVVPTVGRAIGPKFRELAELMGHSDLSQVMKYALSDEARARAGVARL
jgi:hypothetical protein